MNKFQSELTESVKTLLRTVSLSSAEQNRTEWQNLESLISRAVDIKALEECNAELRYLVGHSECDESCTHKGLYDQYTPKYWIAEAEKGSEV